MKSRLLILLLFTSSLVFIQSCCCKKKTTDTAETSTTQVKITAEDNGKTFKVKNGEQFEATFNECVGCSQIWNLATTDMDKVEVLPNTYSNRSCTNCTGGTQDVTFHLKAKSTGKAALTFTYFEQKVSVTIEIE